MKLKEVKVERIQHLFAGPFLKNHSGQSNPQIGKENQPESAALSGSVGKLYAAEDIDEKLYCLITYLERLEKGICILDENLKICLYNHIFLTLFQPEMNPVVGQSIEKIWCNCLVRWENDPLKILRNIKLPHPAIFPGKLTSGPEETCNILLIIDQLMEGDTATGYTLIQWEYQQFNERISSKDNEKQKIEEYKKINEEINSLNYMIAHEVYSPLRIIEAFSKILLSDHEKNLHEEVKKIIRIIQERSDRGKRVVNDLLSMLKLDKEHQAFTNVDLDGLLKALINEISVDREKVTISIPEILPVVSGKYSLIYQIFLNLLDNAIKYSTDKEKSQINISFNERDGDVLFHIEDNGIGIEKIHIDKVFDPFFRIGEKESFKGSGLGLAIVRKLILYHCGSIWVESEKDKFTRFSFTLPLMNKETVK